MWLLLKLVWVVIQLGPPPFINEASGDGEDTKIIALNYMFDKLIDAICELNHLYKIIYKYTN